MYALYVYMYIVSYETTNESLHGWRLMSFPQTIVKYVSLSGANDRNEQKNKNKDKIIKAKTQSNKISNTMYNYMDYCRYFYVHCFVIKSQSAFTTGRMSNMTPVGSPLY